MKPQRGFALLESIAVLAIVALGGGVLVLAASASAKLNAAPERNRAAAALLAAQTLRVAENVWKYGSPGEAPAGSATAAMKLPGSNETVPVTISSAITSRAANGATLTITVSYPSGAVTISEAVRVKAPLPGAQVEQPELIPQPAATF